MIRRGYLIVMLPSVIVAAGKLVVPRVSVRVPLSSAFAATATVNGTDTIQGVPSPMLMRHVPENVAVPPPGAEPRLALPSTTISCGWPKADVPRSVV